MTMIMERRDWMRKGGCIGEDTALWVRERGESYRVAQAICDECPVRTECLEFALADPNLIGMWGGKNDRERKNIRRARQKKARQARVA